MTQIQIIRSDNKEMILGGDTWGITSLSGVDFPDLDVYSEKLASGYGNVVTGKRFGSRTVKIKAKTKSITSNCTARNFASSFFNGNYTYKLVVDFCDVERWISAELDKIVLPQEPTYKKQELQCEFFCEKPFFKSMDDFGKNIASETASFGFPYIDFTTDGTTPTIEPKASVFNFSQSVTITNNGDVETYCIIEIRANNEVTNPKISKGDNYVRLIDVLESGDVVEIDLENATVTKNDINVSNLLDKTSTFTDMQLDVGDNTVSFSADDGENAMDVVLYYNEQFMGV